MLAKAKYIQAMMLFPSSFAWNVFLSSSSSDSSVELWNKQITQTKVLPKEFKR